MKSVLFGDLSDEDLEAKIASLRGNLETALGGGVATVVAGHGRRVEYTRANAQGLQSLLKDAINERARRRGEWVSGAIPVVFPYGGGGR